MDAILISANPDMVTVDDAIRHLADHDELYWEVGFRIARDHFSYPLFAFIHMSGGQVEYRAKIRDIIPFTPDHYEDKTIAERVKPGRGCKSGETTATKFSRTLGRTLS